jgi:transcriptional regulator with XRE-family HTH domain
VAIGGGLVVPRLGNLKAIRESKYLTQEMLSERSGVSRPTIARLERGDEEARFSTIWKLAQALGVEPDALVSEGPS